MIKFHKFNCTPCADLIYEVVFLITLISLN